ncbi:acyltransferase family protein [Sulfobacillus thermosulfidooxidans]|uniref:acyltransferase family protein n=1 Tax=Sulfobacillus thermosulfidooxidans TaxID=28034 RepID=UPI00096B78FE|nr:acyltransferase [Sulfobacillus thermosulfidooxidans]OLZ08171.1 hypothetical protein BFX05_05200 [Sulfobacillus thermosulfidooxidans]OLZ14969.1 hypothetical protein BFX06_05050 [Sulfobacillus thermosulfidooxidans]OLZ19672.1 hypothetical protein BFX07_03160 [Sulfobacillus thermosulfidooxidans]
MIRGTSGRQQKGWVGSSPPRYARLDALRGIAILSVMVFHAAIIRPFHGPWWMRFVGQGDQGVGLFYMVSALTLVLSWQYRHHKDAVPAKAFWTRRFFRIAPLFYLMLLVTGLWTTGNPTVVPTTMQGHIFTWANLLAHVTFVFGWVPWFQNSWIGVEWSIGVEMTFYALFPFVMRRIFPKVSAWTFLVWGLMGAVLWPIILQHLWFTWPHWAHSFLLWSFPTQAIWFAAGLGMVKFDHGPTLRGWSTLWLMWALFLGWHEWSFQMANLFWVIPNYLLVWLTWKDYSGLSWLVHNRVLQYIGTRSYSLYLTHWFILGKVSDWSFANTHTLQGFVLRLFVAGALSLAVSELSFRYIEKPGINWGKRLIAYWQWGYAKPGQSSRPSVKQVVYNKEQA